MNTSELAFALIYLVKKYIVKHKKNVQVSNFPTYGNVGTQRFPVVEMHASRAIWYIYTVSVINHYFITYSTKILLRKNLQVRM